MKFRSRNLHFLFSIGIVLLIISSPLFGYITRKAVLTGGTVVVSKWSSFPITWRMNPTQGSNVTGTGDVAAPIRLAFQTWASIPTANIQFTEGATLESKPGFDQVNLITTSLSPAEWAVYGVDALSLTNVTTSVSTGQIIDADIIFNPNTSFSFNTPTPTDRVDLQAVATHEIGHLLGLDHSPLTSAVMFPVDSSTSLSRTLTSDDTIGVSTLYPTAAFSTRGAISGTVRAMTDIGIYGAIVVAVGQNGQPMATTVTGPDGKYTIAGLPSGSYTIFAEPMDGPFVESNFLVPLSILYPSKTVNINFTTRFR